MNRTNSNYGRLSRTNFIPDEVKMQLTLRYFSDETISKVISAIKRISEYAAKTAGMPDNKLPKVFVDPVETPPVLNNAELSKKIDGFAEKIISRENIIETQPEMVGEDFGKYGLTPENVPICLIWLGSTSPDLMNQLEAEGKRPSPLHSSTLTPDYENTIRTGIEVMTGNVIGLMQN